MTDLPSSRAARLRTALRPAALLARFRQFTASVLLIAVALVCFGLVIGADAHLFEDARAYQLDGEAHVFLHAGRPMLHVVRGDNTRGFRVDTVAPSADGRLVVPVSFPLDSSTFEVAVASPVDSMVPPPSRYATTEPVVAVSDFESGYGAFRAFLMAHGIANAAMQWTFATGHLVLVGDFVDRGASTTPLLWAIYKLEQSARAAGGAVHFIIGNHEIKNLQANFQTTNEKYFHIAGILGKRQDQLLDDQALLGRWLASHNAVEVINDVAFVHGGLHPDLARYPVQLDDINRIVRDGYRIPYFSPATVTVESFLRSGSTGPAWYRGYFKDDLTAEQVAAGLRVVGATRVVVGHTLQRRVTSRHGGQVLAIDVRHPKDYLTSFPLRRSEGVMFRGGRTYRLLANGEAKVLSP